MRFRFFNFIVPLAGCLFVAGCASSKSNGETKLENVNFWQPHLLYLHAAPCARLYVEIDAVAGCEPSETALTPDN